MGKGEALPKLFTITYYLLPANPDGFAMYLEN